MKALTLLSCLTLVGCATGYQSQSFTGGYSDFLQAPDVATITYRGNGYTDALRVVEMAALHCCDVTLQHGYRYCVVVGAGDLSRTSSFTTPGYAYTSGSAFGTYGGGFTNVYGSTNTTYSPPITHTFYKPALALTIKMGNDAAALAPLGVVINGIKAQPKDAAFVGASLRQYLGIQQ
jgi:hypothetical protein